MILKIIFIVAFASKCLATVPRPRGVSISMASLYKPGVPFHCLDQSKEVPFEYINDDYCDCPDGSDEPGTAACPSGKFHCTNAGYMPTNILSSRVNDGICDCCDGTDEWDGNIQCVNNCKELGKKMREESERVRQLQEEGYKLKLKFMEEGKITREQKKLELEQKEKAKVDLEAVKTEMEARKTDVEAPEKEAKDKHEEAWKAEVEKRKAEKEKYRAEVAFYELDENRDHKVTIQEIKAHIQFDVDSNGEVSDDEAKEHLEGEDAVELPFFEEKIWPHIKEFYKPPGSEDPAKGDNDGTTPEPPKHRPPGVNLHAATTTDTAIPQLTVPEMEEETKGDNGTEDDEKMPDYDEPTKQLIAAADEARNQFNDADTNLRNAENEIRNLQTYLGIDYGPDEEYSVMKGNCYEYTDREYTYKLCGFDRATQRSKSGGSETTLGNWGRWVGSDTDKYAAQLYENGQSCWNGPNRSVKVIFKCGLEHKVTSASEPSRCEYAFDFETPSKCTEPPKSSEDHIHTEL